MTGAADAALARAADAGIHCLPVPTPFRVGRVNTYLIDDDPHFRGTPPDDFRLRDDSPAFELGFHPIPVDRIGLYESAERASWPVEHVVREKPAEVGD